MTRLEEINAEYTKIAAEIALFFINSVIMNDDMLDVMKKMRSLKEESNKINAKEKEIDDKWGIKPFDGENVKWTKPMTDYPDYPD